MRNAEHSHVPVAICPVELPRLAPVGRMVATDEGTESSVSLKLLMQ